MEQEVKIIISKDALCRDYLHFYGERKNQFKTPNIDELISKGTVFYNHITAAPSTVMSFYSMVTGKFAHETKYEMYERCHDNVTGDTMFSKLKEKGFHCHIIWDDMWDVLQEYFDYFHNDVEVHSLVTLRESVGVHKKKDGDLFTDDEKAHATLLRMENLIKDILKKDEKTFIWVHLPHVLSGRACYGADIDLFDEYVGMIRKYVDDSNITITADHGNMNGLKGKLAYGFDVYDKVIKIPLIVPRIDGIDKYYDNTSSVDLFEIVFQNNIPKRDFIYSDSAYRAQKSRKLAIVYKNYKYIYTKRTKREELYDLEYDPNEDFSIIDNNLFDVDRRINISIREEYYYPNWSEISEISRLLREEKNRIWRNGSFKVVAKSNIKDLLRPIYDLFFTKR